MSVASPRKVAANRANALVSTGPRTAAGKARSARNAVRHGLCSEGWADPAISRAIERVGRRLAGEAAGQERELAYAVAAAQVDLARAREAGRRICAQAPIAAALARSLFPPGTPAAVAPDEDPEQLEELLCDAVYQLEAIKRYERRAFARRERAIRVLDDRRTGAEPPPRRLPRPRGLRLPRWRLPNPDGRVIRFEGLPRWAWWRPDPLDAPPKTRRAPRRKPETEVAGELELLVSSALLARPRPGASDVGESRDAGSETGWPIRESHDLTPLPARSAIDQLPDAGLTATDPATASPEPDAAGFPCSPTPLGGEGIIEKWSETKPPQTGAGQSGQAPPAPDSSAPASPGTTLTQHQSETKPWLRVSRPTPLPTCRAGPCRWVGEMPADHWSYRSWRYRRPPAHAAGFGAPPQIDPLVQRCPGSPRGRSRAPP
jgi:hypothetical protein